MGGTVGTLRYEFGPSDGAGDPSGGPDLMPPEQLHRINRALADPTRLGILERIANGKEVACADMAGECTISQPTLSHHLKELASAGLIHSRREAKFFFYRLDRKVWSAYLGELRRRIPLRPRAKPE